MWPPPPPVPTEITVECTSSMPQSQTCTYPNNRHRLQSVHSKSVAWIQISFANINYTLKVEEVLRLANNSPFASSDNWRICPLFGQICVYGLMYWSPCPHSKSQKLYVTVLLEGMSPPFPFYWDSAFLGVPVGVGRWYLALVRVERGRWLRWTCTHSREGSRPWKEQFILGRSFNLMRHLLVMGPSATPSWWVPLPAGTLWSSVSTSGKWKQQQ